jgi:hypothetical protein
MPAIKRKKCRHCHDLFVPDHRNRNRQKYCRKPACSKASKAASQKRWLQKPENQNYFRGPENAQRVQQWRKEHPGYSSRKPKITSDALQDPLIHQPIENVEDNSKFVGCALQDLLTMQPAVIIGIIAQLTGYALQDDIAMAVRRMQKFGNDILNPQSEGGDHGNQTSD